MTGDSHARSLEIVVEIGEKSPFFPRILVGLVGLQHLVIQWHPVAVPEGHVLQPVPQVQKL